MENSDGLQPTTSSDGFHHTKDPYGVLVVRPGAPSSVLPTSSDALCS